MNRYGTPTTYKRITPDRGCGFILKSIYELTEAPGLIAPQCPTKKDVYFGTRWYKRPGFASLLWSALIKNGLIESNGGIQNYKYHGWYSSKDKISYRAMGSYEFGRGYTVRYHLTPKGRGVLYDMMDRYNKIRKKKEYCKRNGIEFGAGRSLNTVGSVAEFDAKKDTESRLKKLVERMTVLENEIALIKNEMKEIY